MRAILLFLGAVALLACHNVVVYGNAVGPAGAGGSTGAGGTGPSGAGGACGGLSFANSVEYVVGTDSFSLAAADLNGDGKIDLAVANANYWACTPGTVGVLLNQGDDPFAGMVDYPAVPNAASIQAADLNGDGKPDIVVVENEDNNGSVVGVLMNHGDGTFAAKVDYPVKGLPTAVGVADLNGDGKPDLAVTCLDTDSAVNVMLNHGDGTFAAPVAYPTGTSSCGMGAAALAAADLNGDGKIDLAVANEVDNAVSVLLNQGDGTFAAMVEYPTSISPSSIVAADLNGDGKPDLATQNQDNSVSVLLNHGDGTFAAKVDYPASSCPNTLSDSSPSITAADLNGDGKPDLAVGDWFCSNVIVFLNQGDGTFCPGDVYPIGASPLWIVAADLNGDGKPDLATADYDNQVSVLLNTSP